MRSLLRQGRRRPPASSAPRMTSTCCRSSSSAPRTSRSPPTCRSPVLPARPARQGRLAHPAASTAAACASSSSTCDRLPLFLAGSDDVAFKLYELALGACVGVLVLPPQRPAPWCEYLPAANVRALGFDDDEALLPVTLAQLSGLPAAARVLRVSAALSVPRSARPGRAGAPLPGRRARAGAALFARRRSDWKASSTPPTSRLFCTPAINLFRQAHRPHSPRRGRLRVPRGAGPHAADGLRGLRRHRRSPATAPACEAKREFLPLYCGLPPRGARARQAYFTLQREPRLLSASQQRSGARSSYIGSEVFLSLVDPARGAVRRRPRAVVGHCAVHQPRPAAADAARCRRAPTSSWMPRRR